MWSNPISSSIQILGYGMPKLSAIVLTYKRGLQSYPQRASENGGLVDWRQIWPEIRYGSFLVRLKLQYWRHVIMEFNLRLPGTLSKYTNIQLWSLYKSNCYIKLDQRIVTTYYTGVKHKPIRVKYQIIFSVFTYMATTLFTVHCVNKGGISPYFTNKEKAKCREKRIF